MVERVDDTLDVATEASVNIVLVCFLSHMEGVVALVAIHKAVGHDKVDHISRGESLTLTTTFAACVDGVIYRCGAFVLFEGYTIGTSLIYSKIYKKVVLALGIVLTCDLQTSSGTFDRFAIIELLDSDLGISQVLALKHESKWTVHFCPPAQRLCSVDARFSTER